MREILFRGKRIDNGEWVCGYYVYDESGQLTEKAAPFIYRLNVHPCGCSLIPYEVIPETVGQYTGLTDKNGKRIFEGDIVTAYNAVGECTHTATAVKWNDFFAEWSIGKCNSMYSDGRICSYEVIGNIHDNPELLKGGAE